MLEKIKTLADEAVALQNKDRMDAALREISALCESGGVMDFEQFEAAEKAQHDAGKFPLPPATAPEKAAAKKAAKK